MTETVRPILIDLPDELIGERVTVRPYRAGDGQQLWEAVEESRQHVEPWLPWGDTHKTSLDSEEFVRKMLVKWILREDMPAGVFERSSGRYLGGTGLHRINWDSRAFEIGYWLRKSEEGKGYMTEAVSLLLKLAFETLEANRVFIRAATANTRSGAIPQRLGFTHEGIERASIQITTGEIVDMNVYSMVRPEYFKCADQGQNA